MWPAGHNIHRKGSCIPLIAPLKHGPVRWHKFLLLLSKCFDAFSIIGILAQGFFKRSQVLIVILAHSVVFFQDDIFLEKLMHWDFLTEQKWLSGVRHPPVVNNDSSYCIGKAEAQKIKTKFRGGGNDSEDILTGACGLVFPSKALFLIFNSIFSCFIMQFSSCSFVHSAYNRSSNGFNFWIKLMPLSVFGICPCCKILYTSSMSRSVCVFLSFAGAMLSTLAPAPIFVTENSTSPQLRSTPGVRNSEIFCTPLEPGRCQATNQRNLRCR